jgi:hypothetical protein
MDTVRPPTSGAVGETQMRTCNRRQASIAVAAATLALFVSGRVMADTDNGYVVDHGITIYYATIPAEIIRGIHRNIPRPRCTAGFLARCMPIT